MIDDSFLSIHLPYTLFETVARFNDSTADDMQYGDMGEQELLSLGLNDVSAKVDPYRLLRYISPRKSFVDGSFSSSVSCINISHAECVDILFKEMKEHSKMFSFQGEHKMLIGELIDHFRYGNGSGFYSPKLNSAFHSVISKSDVHSPVFKIKDFLQNKFSTNTQKISFSLLIDELKVELLSSRLTKFNSPEDRINGLAISVHDITAQKITLLSLQRYLMGWSATIHCDAQDHFGLDVTDIKNKIYHEFRFFRIWFFLQRHKDFAFKPFFTNFNTVVQIGEY